MISNLKNLIPIGLASLVLGCSTIPNIPLDEFCRVSNGENDTINLEIDTKRDGKTDVTSTYSRIAMGITNGGIINYIEYNGLKSRNLFIVPDFSGVPKVSLKKVSELMVPKLSGTLLMGINANKSDDLNMVADFDINPDNGNLNYKGYYETTEGYKFHPNPKYHPKQKVSTFSNSSLTKY